MKFIIKIGIIYFLLFNVIANVQSQGLVIGSNSYLRSVGSPRLLIIDGNFKNDGNYIKATENVVMQGSVAGFMFGAAPLTDMYNLKIINTGGITTRLNRLNTYNTDIELNSKLTIDTSSYVYVSNLLTNNATEAGLLIKANANAPNGSLAFMNPDVNPVLASVEMYSLASWNLNAASTEKYKWQFFGLPVKSSTYAMPFFEGAYVRKHNESGWYQGFGTDKLWMQLSANDAMENIAGYELVQAAAKIYTFSGELYNQSINKTLAYTATAQYPGQYVFGNPFTAAIDIKEIVFGSATNSTVYQYNTGTFAEWLAGAAGKTGSTPGQYNVSTKNTAGDVGIPRYIASMQGFVVRATSSSELATISIPYSAVVAKNVEKLRAKKQSENNYTVIDVTGNRFSDRMWMYVNEQFTRDFDTGWDAKKLSGIALAPLLSAKEESGSYQIDAVPDFNNTIINFRKGEDSSYKISFRHYNIESIYNQLYLLDLNTNDLIDISLNNSVYYFTASNTSTEPRFKILTSAGLTTELKDKLTRFYTTTVNSDVVLHNLTGSKGIVNVYNTSGVLIKNTIIEAENSSSVRITLPQGIYIYKVFCESGLNFNGKFLIE